MPKLIALCSLILCAGLVWFWQSGGFDQLAAWAAAEQRVFQNQIATSLRGLRTGEPGAMALLLSVCFAYGFFHAIGPGHGKVLIGGYGLGRDVPWLRLSAISLVASLGQAVTAIVLVYTGIFIFRLTRERLVGVTEEVMAPLSYGFIAAIGLWLIWRGGRRFWRGWAARQHAAHGHEHGHTHGHSDDETHSDACSECGHKHGASLEEVGQVSSVKEALILIAGIAARPCTGALFVLVLTWQMGIAAAGIAGAFAMALGTGVVTILVGLAAAGLRGGLIGAVAGSSFATRVIPVVEVLAGGLIMAIASGLLLRAIA